MRPATANMGGAAPSVRAARKPRGEYVRRFRWIAVVCAAMLATAITAGSAAGQGGGAAQTASDVGISPTEIRIGVVADTGSSLAPGLFQGAVDATQAWAKYMNEKEGGLAGRKIVVDTYDSSLDANKSRNAIIEACGKDFAIIRLAEQNAPGPRP